MTQWSGCGGEVLAPSWGMTIDVRPAPTLSQRLVLPRKCRDEGSQKRERGDVISIRVREARCARAKGAGHEARAGRQRQRAHLLDRARRDAHGGPVNEALCAKTALVTITEDVSSESA